MTDQDTADRPSMPEKRPANQGSILSKLWFWILIAIATPGGGRVQP